MKSLPARQPSRFNVNSGSGSCRRDVRYSAFLFTCILLTLLFGVPPQECSGADTSRWPACDTSAVSQKISFVHVSDIHANYNPAAPDGHSPLAGIKGLAERVRQENPYTVFSNGGDDYEKGSIAEELSHGLTTRLAVQAMEYDVRTIGNHDFAWGLEELLAFSHDPTAAVLASNTQLFAAPEGKNTNTPGWVDYTELTVGCVKIGFFGLVSRPWAENGEQYDGAYYHDHPELQSNFNYIAIARDIIAERRPNVDLLVLVSHLGIHDDIRLAEETQGIDIILGGHTHTTLTQPLQIGTTTIVHTGSHGDSIGRLDLDYNLRDKEIHNSHFVLIPNREGETPVDDVTDQEIKRIIQPYHEAINTAFVRINAAQSAKDMARIAAQAGVAILGCDAAFINPQSAWSERMPGWLTPQDILNIFPVEREPAGGQGSSSLYLIRGTGADMLRARAALPDFAYVGPENIDPAMTYTIALPMAQALRQSHYFGHELGIEPPTPVGEIWEAVVAFGHDQNNAQLALDDKTPAQRRNLIAGLRR
jgi:5'-nucleotidase / UDP-sugar diphosphatase